MNAFRRPNILVIYTDQQRWDTLSCNGQQAVRTPNIDALAAMGARLDQCYVQNPVCAPSRASFLSGQYCSSLRIGTNGVQFPQAVCTLPGILRSYGYTTAQIGKLHFEPHARRDHRNPALRYGFDIMIQSDEPGCYDDAYTKWVERVAPEQLDRVRTMLPPAAVLWGKKGYSDVPRNTHEPYCFEADASLTHTAFVTAQTCDFIRRQNRNTPYFAVAGYYAPHPPLNPPREYVSRVDRSKIRLPVVGAEENISPMLKDMTDEAWRDVICAYLAMVAQVDDGVGELLNCIRQRNEMDNTIIVFTSDHGEFLGDHGRIQKWMPGHDCITHVPCLISYPPMIPAGRVCGALTEAIDIAPTLLDYCGVQTPAFMQGRSLENLLAGTTDEHKEAVLTEYFGEHGDRQTTVRTRRYKYYCPEQGQEILFDLEKDPDETHNCIDEKDYADALSQMRLHMIRAIQRAAYQGLPRIDEY